MRRAFAVALLLVPSLFPAAEASEPAVFPSAGEVPALPSDQALEEGGYVVGQILVRRVGIFDTSDPLDDRRLFRAANHLHATTRPTVIERQLLFHTGEPYSAQVLEESERRLRADRYLFDARIRPVRVDGNHVDIEVLTRDVWTTRVGFGFGHAGGVGSTHFLLHDVNLLGSGKGLGIGRENDVDRTRSVVRFDDPALLGSQAVLHLLYAQNSDGDQRQVVLGQPFYSLDSRWSAALDLGDEERVDPLYTLGEKNAELHHQSRHLSISGGLSRGLRDHRVTRWSMGFTYQRDLLDPLSGAAAPALEGAADRVLAYPWIGVEWIGDDFVETANLDHMGRVEDLALGLHASMELGWSTSLFGGNRRAVVFSGGISNGFGSEEKKLLLLSVDGAGRWGSDGVENLLISGRARYYWRNFGEHLLLIEGEADVAEQLDPERQLLLGGDSGLRGYPQRYQEGERRALLSIEQRIFTSWYPFRLFYVGGALFADVGRTWRPTDPSSARGLLGDVGVGLRLTSSRSALGGVLHLDLAVPLQRSDSTLRSVQWLIRTRTSF